MVNPAEIRRHRASPLRISNEAYSYTSGAAWSIPDSADIIGTNGAIHYQAIHH